MVAVVMRAHHGHMTSRPPTLDYSAPLDDMRFVLENVVDLAGLPAFRPPLSGFGGLGVTFIQEGQPMTQIIGRAYYADGDSVSSINVQIGNSNPDFRVGFVNDITYKSLNLSFVLDWQQGGSVINLTQYLHDHGRTSRDWGTPEWEERYLHFLNGSISPYVEDATFLKLRELALSFALPQDLTRAVSLGAQDVRIGVTGVEGDGSFAGGDGLALRLRHGRQHPPGPAVEDGEVGAVGAHQVPLEFRDSGHALPLPRGRAPARMLRFRRFGGYSCRIVRFFWGGSRRGSTENRWSGR